MSERTETSVLVVEDEDDGRESIARYLKHLDCQVQTAESLAEARQILERKAVDILFVDFELPDGNGAELTRWALAQKLAEVAYCITAHANCNNVVELMQSGCCDVIEKPIDLDRIATIIAARRPVSSNDLTQWRRRFASDMVGEDPRLIGVLRVVRNVADTDCTVLITGESGTGKELVARAVHNASERRDRPFVAVNCAAIPDSLIEAELFGHARGAFTGAIAARDGQIASAEGGTLFLDEVGDMPLAAQAKLLRVLQERCVTPVGSDRSIPINVRVVAATNKDLEAMVEADTFRADLFFRLNVVPVHLPALRERASDVLPLARHILELTKERFRRNVRGFDESAEAALRTHAWPGNVRQLCNTIERAVVLRGEGSINAKDLQLSTKGRGKDTGSMPAVTAAPSTSTGDAESLDLRSAIDELERRMVRQALERTGGNRTEAAVLLGLNRTTLIEKIRKLG